MSKSFQSGIRGTLSFLALASLTAAGCSDEAPPELATSKDPVLCRYCSMNGPYLQNGKVDGMLIRSIVRNAADENWNVASGMGTAVDSLPLSSISFNGKSVLKLRGDRGFFSVTYFEPPFSVKTKGGTATAGLKLKFSMVNGAGQRKGYQLKIFNEITPASSTNYAQYDIRWALDNGQSDANNTWTNVCGLTPDGTQLNSFIVTGSSWNIQNGSRSADANAITIACQDDAVGACIDWGYEPWVDRTGCQYQWYPAFAPGLCATRSGADIHQTCTRSKRADFSGLGYSYTDSGTMIFVADSLNSTVRPLDPTFPNTNIEAVWGPDGAACLNQNNMRTPEYFPNQAAYDAYLSIPRCLMPPTPLSGLQITGYDGN